MPPTPPGSPATTAGYVVLDLDLPDRPPLAEADDWEAGLHLLAVVQEDFLAQLDANGEGGGRVRLALTLAPRDALGTIGTACHWSIINGLRPTAR